MTSLENGEHQMTDQDKPTKRSTPVGTNIKNSFFFLDHAVDEKS